MWIIADVVFDSDDQAREAKRLASEGKLAGVSVDLGNVTAELEVTEVDEEGLPTDWVETITSAEILGATQVAMPAFAEARIEFLNGSPVAFLAPEGMPTSDRRTISPSALTWREGAPLMFNDTSDGHTGAVHVGNLTNFRRSALVAGQWATLVEHPFTLPPPQLSGLTKPKIEAGRLEGHGAGWGTCHTAFRNACVTAPSSTYSQVADGIKIYKHRAGDIHAPLSLAVEDAKEWYDTNCDLVAFGAVGEDDFGIWVNTQTDLDDGEVFLSGDWREVDGELELISFLVVDNPGFPTAMVASDTQTALTAAGIVTETDELSNRVARLESKLEDITLTERAKELEKVFA